MLNDVLGGLSTTTAGIDDCIEVVDIGIDDCIGVVDIGIDSCLVENESELRT